MRLLHLYWPHLPLRLARARRSDSFPTDRPVVLGGQPWTDGTVIDADPAARALGVRRGIPLGSAHRLAPEATFLDPEPDADAASVEAAFEVLARFSPGLAGVTDQADPAFGLLEVQVDGLERLWGSEPETVGRLVAALAGVLPGQPRPGIAGTRFAATVAAGNATPPEPRIVRPDGEAAFLAPLPASLLSSDQDVRARLRRFGLRQIGAVAELPRSALVARFGAEGELLHDRARGVEIHSFRPRRAPGAPRPRAADRAGRRRAGPAPVRPAPPRRDAGRPARRPAAPPPLGAISGCRWTSPSLRAPLRTGSPSSSASPSRPPMPRRSSGSSSPASSGRPRRRPVARVELELAGVEPAVGQQLPLFVPQAARNARLGWQLARLALTFGEDRVRRVALADPDAPLAESRWTWRP